MYSKIMNIGIKIVHHKATNYVLVALMVVSLGAYVYFANSAVRIVTVLQKIKQENQLLSINVSEMEAKRMNIENTLTSDKAFSLGFVEVHNPKFIVKSPKNTSLSLKID